MRFLLSIPFIGVILSIAILPLIAHKTWHRFESLILALWGTLGILIIYQYFDISWANHKLFDAISQEYIPFIIMISTLYVISSGLYLNVNLNAKPWHNTVFLLISSLFASLIGTTGAAMVFIRPFLKMNHIRTYNTHNMMFFIFLVANIGGCLTPLGDPPLFLGFLQGVPFFWVLTNLWPQFLLVFIPLILIYFVIDWYFWKKEEKIEDASISIKPVLLWQGKRNLLFLLLAILIIFASQLNGTGQGQAVIRDACLILIAITSYLTTPKNIHTKQNFSINPIIEIARIFLVIFITMIPVVSLLKNQTSTHQLSNPLALFWITGIFSAFLDNAPTYLLFLKMSGYNITELITQKIEILKAISLGAVYMGAFSYIGNAPNFMVKSIAQHNGVKPPSFFGYMLWSTVILLPIFLIMSFICW